MMGKTAGKYRRKSRQIEPEGKRKRQRKTRTQANVSKEHAELEN
jgi:hypothetical protein